MELQPHLIHQLCHLHQAELYDVFVHSSVTLFGKPAFRIYTWDFPSNKSGCGFWSGLSSRSESLGSKMRWSASIDDKWVYQGWAGQAGTIRQASSTDSFWIFIRAFPIRHNGGNRYGNFWHMTLRRHLWSVLLDLVSTCYMLKLDSWSWIQIGLLNRPSRWFTKLNNAGDNCQMLLMVGSQSAVTFSVPGKYSAWIAIWCARHHSHICIASWHRGQRWPPCGWHMVLLLDCPIWAAKTLISPFSFRKHCIARNAAYNCNIWIWHLVSFAVQSPLTLTSWQTAPQPFMEASDSITIDASSCIMGEQLFCGNSVSVLPLPPVRFLWSCAWISLVISSCAAEHDSEEVL